MDMPRRKPNASAENILDMIEAEYRKKKKAAAGESEVERDARITRVETSWAQASFSPNGKVMMDGTAGVPRTLMEPPKGGPAGGLGADFAFDSHMVVAGETWSSIAPQYGVSVLDLQKANPRVPSNRLIPGVRLTIPGT
jgi:LysM repeat protein